jgi:putative transposase
LEFKKGLIRSYNSQGLSVVRLCEILGITRNQYYHIPKTGKRGRKASTDTKTMQGELKTNEEVVNRIIKINDESLDINYGYQKMTSQLQFDGFIINHKKVERLMRSQGLLQIIKKDSNNKTYVRFRKANSESELEILEIDIKYKKVTTGMAYIMTVLDTFTRETLYWTAGYNMTKHQVKEAWESVIVEHLQEYGKSKKGYKVEVRSDNGKQFESTIVREYLAENELNQVFTHPYTPEENGHIESFHAILGASIDKEEFDNLQQLKDRLEIFYKTYNHKRIHGSTCNLPPIIFKILWRNKQIELIKDKKRNTIKFKLKMQMCEVKKYLQNKEIKKNNIGQWEQERA